MTINFVMPIRPTAEKINDTLHEMLNANAMTPFDAPLIQFVSDFSKSILLDKRSRDFPELIVLANFFKISNIKRMKEESFFNRSFRFSRGLVFHIAPSNVDSIFLYSSLLSFLCGNVNLIRISRSSGAQFKFALDKLAILFKDIHKELVNRFIVINYDHNDVITSSISTSCHMRVVWGGDATVKKIRSLPLRPTASEICFPDRFSMAMLNAECVLNLNHASLNELCANFYNDSIWFSQQACSSPRLVAWIGDQENCQNARREFWRSFQGLLLNKVYENTPGMVMDRYVTSCLVACSNAHRETIAPEFPTRILLDSVNLAELKGMHCGNGLFYEQFFESASNFFDVLSAGDQTLSVFGFNADELISCLRNVPMRAVDRITKIGHALDFNYVWDGHNLIHSFTREIRMEI